MIPHCTNHSVQKYMKMQSPSKTSLDLGKVMSTVQSLVADGRADPPQPLTTEPSVEKLTRGRKIATVVGAILANCLMLMSYGASTGGGLEIGKSFGVYDPSTATWIAASYPLTHGAFVLVSGRVGAIYGHKNILMLGGLWWSLWSLVNGFCTKDIISFSMVRAISGIGAALVMPNAVAIIGITFPPGRQRNLSFGFFGLACPVAGTIGCILIGVFAQFATWRWFFFTAATIGLALFSTLWFIMPKETSMDKDGTVDWIGACLGLSGLILFNFVWNQSPAVGWLETYQFIILFTSFGLLINFVLWESRFAKQPIMPLNIWTAPSFFPLILVVTFSIMSYATALWYMVAWQQIIRKWTLLDFAAGLVPHAIFGGLAAPVAAWMIPRVAAQWIMALGALAVLLSATILAAMPPQQSYWPQIFPATILMSLCPDFIFTAAQIIVTNSVRRSEQGVAGSLVSLLQLYGASIALGFAGTIEANTNAGGKDEVAGYRGALYFAVALAAAAILISVLFVRVPKDERKDWSNEEDREL